MSEEHTITTNATSEALSAFVSRSLAIREQDFFQQPFDEAWRSPCEIRQEHDTTCWRPTLQTQRLDFSGLAKAAEQPIHPDIQSYYNLDWAGTLPGKTVEGELSLIQMWNEEDFTRLLENLVGHLFYKIRAKAPFTVFFANTEEDSEFFLSVDNDTGVVLLEEPGRPPIKELAPDLATFLNRIEPDNRDIEVY
jgi:SecY interacting protein Syd